MRHSLNLVDKILLVYLLSLTVHIVLTLKVVPDPAIHIGANATIMLGIYLIAAAHRTYPGKLIEFLHLFYPIFLLIWLYPQVCLLRFTVIPQDLDPIIIEWDNALFGQQLYVTIASRLNLFWQEFFHGIYFLYYISLGLFAMLTYRSQRQLVNTYLFTLMLCMCVHQWSVVLFPSAGPMHLRDAWIHNGVFFIPIMNFIYNNVDKGGGAFPSLHSAAVVVVAVFASKMFPKWTIPISLFCAGVLLSTFANLYHYPIDALAGAITGGLCAVLFPKLYGYIQRNASH
ncbi:MAG: phosphatase PAP2 family protein [Candidatus Marinimicrobia bacterium]|nr:phosphatase PAP2 family protein [Candidatus Neomarinimicrobiota bacterium]MDP6789298.1 phosphatase PAP2 family protein [Candidatus Neomarinimicrobiota bacterium]MDP7071788.1 phosphatase PAP2 family protein [Candidatus Neomarinimicrobiota bacterium]